MDKREGMKHFDRGARQKRLFIAEAPAAGFMGSHDKRRPDTLAARKNAVSHKRVD